MEEKKNVNNRSMINEYKILMVLIVLSIVVGLMVLILCLTEQRAIITFSLGFGLAIEIYFLYTMVLSLKSEDKWSVIVDFNSEHEGIFELIFMVVLIIIGIIAIIVEVL